MSNLVTLHSFSNDCPMSVRGLKQYDVWLTAGVTGQQRMLTPPRPLILPSPLSGVRGVLNSTLYTSMLFGFMKMIYPIYRIVNFFYHFIAVSNLSTGKMTTISKYGK